MGQMNMLRGFYQNVLNLINAAAPLNDPGMISLSSNASRLQAVLNVEKSCPNLLQL